MFPGLLQLNYPLTDVDGSVNNFGISEIVTNYIGVVYLSRMYITDDVR